jgi:hypothetical protein
MKTSSWRLYQGPGRISISRFAPRSAPPGYAVCRRLIPGTWFNKVGADEFCARYNAQLAALDPQATLDAIVERAAPYEPVLLCWEVPPWNFPRHWCHRGLVADWFQATLGIVVEELPIPPSAAVRLGRGMVPFWAADHLPRDTGDRQLPLELEP